MKTPSDKQLSPDSEALVRIRKIVRSTPARKSRSRLAPYENEILELCAKKYTLDFIQAFFVEQIHWRPALSTLHYFIKAAKKRRAKRGLAPRPEPAAAESHLSAQPPPSRIHEGSARETGRAAIRAAKAGATATGGKPRAKLFDFDPTQPLITNPTQNS